MQTDFLIVRDDGLYCRNELGRETFLGNVADVSVAKRALSRFKLAGYRLGRALRYLLRGR